MKQARTGLICTGFRSLPKACPGTGVEIASGKRGNAEMKALWLAALAVWAMAGMSAAVEPRIAEQVIPANPQLGFIGRDADGKFVFVDAGTAGVVGETGYAWRVTIDLRNEIPVLFERLVIDCPNNIVQTNWLTYLDEMGAVAAQLPASDVHRTKTSEDEAIWWSTCQRRPLRAAPIDGLGATLSWARTQAASDVDIGGYLKLHEVAKRGTFDITWTRYGRSGLYRAVYTNVATGHVTYDVIEVVGVVDGTVQFAKWGEMGVDINYIFPITSGTIERGHAQWEKGKSAYIEIIEPRT